MSVESSVVASQGGLEAVPTDARRDILQLMGCRKITIGKHKGKSYDDLRKNYVSYASWIIQTGLEETECHSEVTDLTYYLVERMEIAAKNPAETDDAASDNYPFGNDLQPAMYTPEEYSMMDEEDAHS